MSKISIIFSFSLQSSALKPYKKSGTSLNVPLFLSIVVGLSLSGLGKERQMFGCHLEEKNTEGNNSQGYHELHQ